jgi:hypothetical protein
VKRIYFKKQIIIHKTKNNKKIVIEEEDEIPSQELVRGEWDEVTIPNAEKIFG